MVNDKEFLQFGEDPFKPYFEKYIEFKRGKGDKVSHSTLIRLHQLNTVLNQIGCNTITQDVAELILAPRPELSESKRQYMVSDLRQFCSFLGMFGMDAAVIPPKFMRTVKSNFRPYIFSDSELLKVVNEADHLSSANRTNRHQIIYPVLVRLLIGTGMRIGEALALQESDVDIEQGIIKVINGKNGVSRYIPVSHSLQAVLAQYSTMYGTHQPETPFFLSAYTNGHLTYSAAKYMFQRMFQNAGIRNGKKPPNIHSIRHTFCTKSLSRMLDSGMDVYTAVPILAAYVGHVNFADTEKYIHFTEQDHKDFLHQEASLGKLIPEVEDD